METAPRNCRFLSLVVVERVLNVVFTSFDLRKCRSCMHLFVRDGTAFWLFGLCKGRLLLICGIALTCNAPEPLNGPFVN